MHKNVTAAAVLFPAAGVCLAHPPGITREMIERALPLEGTTLAETLDDVRSKGIK